MSPVAKEVIQSMKLDTDSKEYIMGIHKNIEDQSIHRGNQVLQIENAESKNTPENEDSGYIELM